MYLSPIPILLQKAALSKIRRPFLSLTVPVRAGPSGGLGTQVALNTPPVEGLGKETHIQGQSLLPELHWEAPGSYY